MARIIGDKALDARLKSLAGGADVTQALLRGAQLTRQHYVESLMDNTDGRAVVRYDKASGRRRDVMASLPGQSPNTDTGVLAGSSDAQSLHRNQAEAYATAAYAEALEFGTEKMAPRPAMGPAFDATKDEVLAEVTAALRAALKQ